MALSFDSILRVGKQLRQMRRTGGSWFSVGKRIFARARNVGFRALIWYVVAPPPDPEVVLRNSATRQLIHQRFQEAKPEIQSARTGQTISVVMPVHRPRRKDLLRAIDSLKRQTMSSWELCIAEDGSDDAELVEWLRREAATDARIRLVVLPRNEGISSATNAALRLATGRHFALMDQDDLLTTDAIAEVSAAIAERAGDVDMLYSDECKIDNDDIPAELMLKPDWSPHFLMSVMYTGHLSVYRTELVRQIGGFRSEYDFSQDYDLALRVSEVARSIVHIPKVLYGWRMHPASAAAGGKPYARSSNIAALQAAVDRRGYQGGVAEEASYTNRVRFENLDEVVSVIIPSDNGLHIAEVLGALFKHANRVTFEAIVVTNSNLCAVGADRFPAARFVPFDRTFNFSAKCNEGAAVANGNVLLFLNDDVLATSDNWLDEIVATLRLGNVGAVAPKLLYENGTIQHAGMVTGVRRYIGTACHAHPSDTTLNLQMAQHRRNVSVLSGACLAMPANLYRQLGGFDADLFPVAYSDVDLCFRVLEAGYLCVYAPGASLTHKGHASFPHAGFTPSGIKDPSEIRLLKKWARYIAKDPYYTQPMRDFLYRESIEPFTFHVAENPPSRDGEAVLIVFDSLDASEPTRGLVEIARDLCRQGYYVVATAKVDGPARHELLDLGIHVMIDEVVLNGHHSLARTVQAFDFVIAGTASAASVVLISVPVTECAWYVHDADALLATSNKELIDEALARASSIWVPDQDNADALHQWRKDVRIVGEGQELQLRAGGAVLVAS